MTEILIAQLDALEPDAEPDADGEEESDQISLMSAPDLLGEAEGPS